MMLSLLILMALSTTFAWYLGSIATITYRIRVLLPEPVSTFLDCPACSGAWYGLACGVYVHARGLSVLPPEATIVGIACASSVWTSFGAALLIRALAYKDEAFQRYQDVRPPTHRGDLEAAVDDVPGQ